MGSPSAMSNISVFPVPPGAGIISSRPVSCRRPVSSPQGERRFWLGTMVDDHFLDTNVFEYDGANNEGGLVRAEAGGDRLREQIKNTVGFEAGDP